MTHLLVAFTAAFGLALVLTHQVRSIAFRTGFGTQYPGGRHIHERPIPRVGGLGIFLAVALVVGFGLLPEITSIEPLRAQRGPLVAVMAGSAVIFCLGLLDDLQGLTPRTKLAVEVAVAVAMFAAGLRIETIGLFGVENLPGWASLAVTVLWIVGITNAFNLIDGADGVAAGAAVFASGSLAAVSLLGGNHLGAVVALAVAGAALGFLFFNFPPASIFMGDGGSLFIGFLLAALGVLTAQKASTALAVAIPVVSLGLPILDTLLAVVRRFLRGEPLFHADRGHIHHRLRDLGHSPRQVVLLLYLACAGFAFLALFLLHPEGPGLGMLFLLAGVVTWVSVQRLHIPELLELGQMVERGFRQRAVIRHNVRVREAAAVLRRATDGAAVRAAVEALFATGEFERVQLWLPAELAEPLVEAGCPAEVSGDGYRLTWVDEGVQPGEEEFAIEIRLPFRDADGRGIGRLSLWRAWDSEVVLTDVRLIVREFQPELQRALVRLTDRKRGEAGRWTVPAPETASLPSLSGRPS